MSNSRKFRGKSAVYTFILSSVLIVFSIATPVFSFAIDPPPKGVYKLSDGSFITFIEMKGVPIVIFPDGNIRGLRPASAPGVFEYGNAVALFDNIEGRVQVENKGGGIILKTANGEKTGIKIKFKEQNKEFKNGAIKLAGTLIIPEGKGPFPCLIMTHGSGYEKREESRGLACLFAINGIAAFIYDKRGTDQPEEEGEWKASFSDYANDAKAAAIMVAKNKSIDSKHIGIFGHSQGGWVAPLAASKSEIFSYVIISAGNVVTPVEQHLYNGACANRLAGVKEWAIREIYDFRVIKYEAGITGNRAKYDSALPIAKTKPWFVRTGGNLPGGTFWMLNGYYRSDTALSTLKCPVLVIAGELDKYSDTKTNMTLFREIFEKSGNIRNVTFKIFPLANHSFMETVTGKLDDAEMPQLKRFVPGYFETLTGWTKKAVSE